MVFNEQWNKNLQEAQKSLTFIEKIVKKDDHERKMLKLATAGDGGGDKNNNNKVTVADPDDKNEIVPTSDTQLLKFDNNKLQEVRQQYTQEFIEFCKWLNTQLKPLIEQMLKLMGMIYTDTQKDKAIESAKQLLQQINDSCINTVRTLTNGALEKMTATEVQFVNIQFQALQSWIEKISQILNGMDPKQFINNDNVEEIEQELQKQLGTEEAQKVIDQQNVANQNTHKQDEINLPDELLKECQEQTNKANQIVHQVIENQRKLESLQPSEFDKRFFGGKTFQDWFEDKLWSIITSPVATDFVKLFMQTNPITAMIFDGKFGSFGFKDILKNIVDYASTRRKELKQKDIKYDQLGIPQDTDKLTVKEINDELYGNRIFIHLVNVLYNHPSVDKGDKKTMLENTQFLLKNIDNSENTNTATRQQLMQEYNQLLETCRKCCKYLKYNTYKDFINLPIGKNTDTQKQVIDKAQSNQKSNPFKKDIETLMKAKVKRADIIKSLTGDDFGYTQKQVIDYLDKHDYKESLDNKRKSLHKMLEAAEEKDMNLIDINQITDGGLTVFMPSGIQATLFKEGKDIVVQYPNFRKDKYTQEQFQPLMEEGIFIFDKHVSVPLQSALMESEEDNIEDDLNIESALHKSASEEEDAISAYLKRANKAREHNNIKLYNLYTELANDEKVHASQLKATLNKLNMTDKQKEQDGQEEAEKILGDESVEGMKENILNKLSKKGYIRESLAKQFKETEEELTLDYLGIKEDNFSYKKELIDYIEKNTDYTVTDFGDHYIMIKRKQQDEQALKLNINKKMGEAYKQEEQPQGSMFKIQKDRSKEFVTADFKNELLSDLQRIAKEHPDVKVRQQALTFLDELGLQEYYDIKAVKDFCKKHLEVLDQHINESLVLENYTNVPKSVIDNLKTDAAKIISNFGKSVKKWNYEFKIDDGDIIEAYPNEIETKLNKIITDYLEQEDLTSIDLDQELEYDGSDSYEVVMDEGNWKLLEFGYLYLPNEKAISIRIGITFDSNIKNESLNEEDDKFNYMMLDRLRQDCEYFLGFGNRNEKQLWAGNVEDQIAEMRKIYDKLSEKPEWLSLEDINKYEKDMLAKRDSKNESLNEGSMTMADEIRNGEKSGFDNEYGEWLLTTSLDDKWEALTQPCKDLILDNIANQVEEDEFEQEEFVITFDKECGLNREDLESLNMFSKNELDTLFDIENGFLDCYMSYKIEFTNDEQFEDVEESFKLKQKKKKKKLDEKTYKGDNMKKTVNEDSYRVYNSIENSKCGTFNSWGEVDAFLQNEWKLNCETNNACIEDEQAKQDFIGNFDVELLPVHTEIEICPDCNQEPCICTTEIECCPECGEETCICEKPIEEDLEEEQPEETEVNKDIETAEETEYKQIDGVTADPEKVDDVKSTLIFTPEEGQAINDLEPGEKMLLPLEQPDETQPWETQGANEIIKADIEDQSGNKEEIVSQETDEPEEAKKEIEDIISDLLDDEDTKVEIELVKDEDFNPEETKQPTESDLDDIFDAVDTLNKAEWFCKREEDMNVLKKAQNILKSFLHDKDLDESKTNEEFSDKMGMLTDINDLDFPDALANTVETKEDGSLYKIGDVAKMVTELKDQLNKAIEEIKTEIQTELQEIKQDIKIQVNDVENNVKDVKGAVDDLTVEEDDLDAQVDALEQEESPETEEPQETEEQDEKPQETEQQEESIKQESNGNPIVEAVQTILKPVKKISRSQLDEALHDKYGFTTDLPAMKGAITSAIKTLGLDEKISSKEVEQDKSDINKYLKHGYIENLDNAKKKIDDMTRQGKDAKDIKNAITLLTDDEREKEQATDYAVSKMKEALLNTASNSKLAKIRFKS